MAFSGDLAAAYHRFIDGDREARDAIIQCVGEHVRDSWQSVACLSDDEDEMKGKTRAYRAQHPERLVYRVVSLGDGPGVPGVEVAQMLREKYENGPLRFEVFSTDLSEDMCQQARERAKASGFDEEGANDSAEGITSKSAVSMKFIAPLSVDDDVSLRRHFPDGSVDVVLMSFVLMFVKNRETCFAEAARMLRPGGKLVFSVLNEFLMIDVVSNALDELLRDEDTNLKLCRPIRPVPGLALKDWAVYMDGSDEKIGDGLRQLLKIAAPSLKIVSWRILKYDFPLGCREGDEESMLDMFCALITDESWAAITERALHLNGSLEQAKREVRDYVSAVVAGSGAGNRWRFDKDGEQYKGNAYCCPDYAVPVVCCEKPRED